MSARNFIFVACLLAAAVSGATTTKAAKLGESCGGIVGIRCDRGLWCDPSPGQCGVADAAGTCIKIGQLCTRVYLPVCGCNGKTYNNDCERQKHKIGKKSDGKC
jgi:Kazal-type serine protease inhibitor domain